MRQTDGAADQVDLSVIVLDTATPRFDSHAVARATEQSCDFPGSPAVAFRLEVVDAHRAARAARPLLDAAELKRAGQYRDPRDEARYCIAHAALRSTLATRLRVPAHAIAFEREPGGRPRVHAPAVHFSLAYTTGMIAIALAPHPVGVDIEVVRDDLDVPGISARFLAPDEHAAVTDAQGALRIDRFFEVWTRKEALAKACGRGLAALVPVSAARDVATLPPGKIGAADTYAVRTLVPPLPLPGLALAVACARPSGA